MSLEATASRKKIRPSAREPYIPVDKITPRRVELAEAALGTLGELGYSRTSLREISQASQFSHGVFHYYFKDKADLICFCVRHYKAKCVTRYDEIVTAATDRASLLAGFLDKLTETIRIDAPMHRLWYDLRAEALFDADFREDVIEIDKTLEEMIWRIALRYAELGGASAPRLSRGALRAVRRPVPARPARASGRRSRRHCGAEA